jgi:hypothetical protein
LNLYNLFNKTNGQSCRTKVNDDMDFDMEGVDVVGSHFVKRPSVKYKLYVRIDL